MKAGELYRRKRTGEIVCPTLLRITKYMGKDRWLCEYCCDHGEDSSIQHSRRDPEDFCPWWGELLYTRYKKIADFVL